MSLLLDSNVLLWWLVESPRLGAGLLDRLESETSLFISLVTPWELWVKAESGRLRLPDDFDDRLGLNQLSILSPTLADARLASRLPPIHRDPFDRMIIAQALNNRAQVVTGDRQFAAYGVDIILV